MSKNHRYEFQRGPTEFLMNHEYVGIFENATDDLPLCVVECRDGLQIPLRPRGTVDTWVPLAHPLFKVKQRTRCLERWSDSSRSETARDAPDGSGPATLVTGKIRKVRVTPIERGQRKVKEKLYYGRIDLLDFDPNCIKYRDDISFMSYTTKTGRALLKRHHLVPNLARKWTGVLPAHHNFRWTTVWSKGRTVKEAGLIWAAWHKGLTVNDWSAQAHPTIDRNCHVCSTGAAETVLHRFWECDVAQKTWHWAIHLLNLLAAIDPQAVGPRQQFNWKQTIFSARIPRKFRGLGFIWAALKGVVMWTIWISRNDRVFNGIVWPEAKLYQKVWMGLIDYGRVAWQKLQDRSRKNPASAALLRETFSRQWCRNNILSSLSPLEGKVKWVLTGPIDAYRPLYRVIQEY